MSGRNAKLLRRTATASRHHVRPYKREWSRMTAKARREHRGIFERFLAKLGRSVGGERRGMPRQIQRQLQSVHDKFQEAA